MVPHDIADPRTLAALATAFAGGDPFDGVGSPGAAAASTLGLHPLHLATAGAVAGEIANLPPAYALFVQGDAVVAHRLSPTCHQRVARRC